MKPLKFKKLHPDAVLPARARPGDAGLDLTAVSDPKIVNENDYQYVEYDLGVAVEIPENKVGLLFPRSSQSKIGLILANCVGVVDSGFRGNLTARFKPDQSKNSLYKKGDRIVQLVVVDCYMGEAEWADSLLETQRGSGAFGSTGN
jgi:dUTP pyrophosphatase